MVYSLFKHEVYEVVSNKRYIVSLGIQLLILFTIFPLFSSFLSSGTVGIITPAFNEFVPVGVVDESSNSDLIISALEKNRKIELIELKNIDTELLTLGKIAGILVIPKEYDESLNRVLELNLYTYEPGIKSGLVFDAVFPSLEEASNELTRRRKDIYGVTIDNPIRIEKQMLRPLVIEEGAAKFSSFFLSYLVPLLLFFPIFTVGSLILDIVVGEKERKTIESLVVSPAKRWEIVVSKFLVATVFVFFQTVLWLLVLRFYSVPVHNIFSVVLILALTDGAIISLALTVAYFSRTAKEASMLLMLVFTTVFITLMIFLSLNYFESSALSTPFSLVSDLISGENSNILLWAIILAASTLLLLAVNIKLFERDDIVFGPRPSIPILLSDLSLWLYSFGKPGYFYLTAVFGVFALIYSILIELLVAVLIIFTAGFTPVIVPIFAMIEEAVKPVGIYLLSSKTDITKYESTALGVLSGIMFFLLESLILIAAVYFILPERLISVLRLRISTTLVIHAVTSGIVGYGIAEKKNFLFFLLIATAIHTLFNLVVTGGGII